MAFSSTCNRWVNCDHHVLGGDELIELSVFIGPVISAICAFAGSYLAFSTRLTRVEEKVDGLTKSVNKHNEVIERTFRLEERMDSALHSIDDLKEEVHHYHHN